MPKEFILSVVAPDKVVTEGSAISVTVPGSEGYFGIWADHLPEIASLKSGLLEFTDTGNQRHYVFVGGGFLETHDNKVTILADEAQLADQIDISRAEKELEEARRALRGESSVISAEDAVTEIEKAMNRLKAARASK